MFYKFIYSICVYKHILYLNFQDITRIVHSISETAKSNIPFTESEFGPGKGTDLNNILSEVEHFLKQNYKTSDDINLKPQPQLLGVL